MWYLMIWLRLLACCIVLTWGGVQALLNLGFDNRSPFAPLVIALIAVYVLKPDADAMAAMVNHAKMRAKMAEDRAAKARAAMTGN